MFENRNDEVLKAVHTLFDSQMEETADKVVLLRAVTALEKVALEAMALWKIAGNADND